MSYILDALKKAAAERERGQVPGLHASTAAPHSDETLPGHRLPSWAWAALGALMTLVAALVWALTGREAPEPTAPVAVAVPVSRLPEPAPPAPIIAAAPLPAERVTATALANRQARSPSHAGPAASAPDSTAAHPRIYAANELPDEIRQTLPTLTFGGAMYSDQAASRMLIINNQAFHEGDRIADDLVLRDIKLRSATLAFKGYIYAVKY